MTERYNYARDAFIYLLSYATLLIFTVALNFLTKSLINRAIPDPAELSGFLIDEGAVIGFLAAIIIAFPIFWYLNFYANKMLAKGTMRADTGVRHWLIYLTLVVVILVIIWQLVALLIAFLQGTIAARFLLHTLVTLIIAGGVLKYQWWHLKFVGKGDAVKSLFKIFEYSALALVLAAVVWGFVAAGSPSEQRAKRFDEMRVERLRQIQWAVEAFYGYDANSGLGRLPNALAELDTNKTFFIDKQSLVDPKTGEPFEYRTLGATTYELCAVFETSSQDEGDGIAKPVEPAGRYLPFDHGEGRECFELAVR